MRRDAGAKPAFRAPVAMSRFKIGMIPTPAVSATLAPTGHPAVSCGGTTFLFASARWRMMITNAGGRRKVAGEQESLEPTGG